MKFAYADPPYIGLAWRYNAPEIDYQRLLQRLTDDFPDGWALSASSPSLRELLPLCPPLARTMAWVKPFASFKPNVNPAYAWEPLIVFGGRHRGRDVPTVRDWISANITLKKGIVGAKPVTVMRWLLDVLGAEPRDSVCDLFVGTDSLAQACYERAVEYEAAATIADASAQSAVLP